MISRGKALRVNLSGRWSFPSAHERMPTKRTVAIYSNYNASEKTLCALFLIKHILLQRYHHVIWVVPDPVTRDHRYTGFSHEWDTSVVSLKERSEEIQKMLNEPVQIREGTYVPACEICFFFEGDDFLHSLLPKTAKSVLFLDHREWGDEETQAFAKKCTHIFTPSPYSVKAIRHPTQASESILCPFDSAAQLIPKVQLVSGQTATIFYPAYDLTFLERRCVQQIAEIVKECCPGTKSVVGYYDTNEESEPGRDARTFDWKLIDYLKQLDWIVDLNPHPLMGLFGSFAGSLSIQWSCFDLPPNNDDYNGARRHLIPFPKGGLLGKNAEAIAGHIVRQLVVPLNEVERNQGAGSYVKRLKEFYKAMNKIFGAKNSPLTSFTIRPCLAGIFVPSMEKDIAYLPHFIFCRFGALVSGACCETC